MSSLVACSSAPLYPYSPRRDVAQASRSTRSAHSTGGHVPGAFNDPMSLTRTPPVPRPMGTSPASASPFLNLFPRIRTQSSTQASFLRSFSTTRPNMMRPNYFPRSSGSGSGGSPRAGPIRRALIRLDSMPHLYVVRTSGTAKPDSSH
jgi:hypothetical protein